jgi:hypothetical protein
VAGADLFWEKSTAGWLLVAGLFWEENTAGWWLISQTNRLRSLRLKTLSFLSFQTSQMTRRISERTPLRGTSGRCERFFHHRLGDLLAGQTAGLSSVRPAHSATKTQVLCV